MITRKTGLIHDDFMISLQENQLRIPRPIYQVVDHPLAVWAPVNIITQHNDLIRCYRLDKFQQCLQGIKTSMNVPYC